MNSFYGPSKRSRVRCVVSTWALLWLTMFVGYQGAVGEDCAGEDFSGEARFIRILTGPMNSVLDGKPFRSGLESLATEAGVNLWLDRHVDPSVPIQAGPVGPTVFAAFDKLAAAQRCVVMPVMDVVLVGRPDWVDQTASALLSIPATKLGHRQDVAWPDLTTPQESLQLVAGDAEGRLPRLPHDLWPAVNWQQIERQVAMTLVLAQFDGLLPGTDALPAKQPLISRRYSPGIATLADIRSTMARLDPSSQSRLSAGWIIARGNIEAHRAVTRLLLLKAGGVSGPDPDKDTFTLKRMTTSAENALNQLARTAGKTCIIEPEAAQACKQVISIEGHEMSLRQLIEMVAEQAGVTASWQDDKILIAVPR